MKNTLKLVMIITTITFFYACQNESDFDNDVFNTTDEINVEGGKSKIYVSEDGTLNFETTQDFQKTILWIKDLSDKEAVKWSKELGFKSLHSLYMQALSEEEKMIQDFDPLISSMMKVVTDLEIANFKEKFTEDIPLFQKRRSDIQKKYGNYMHIKNGRIINMKTYDAIVSRLITKEGYVYVSGSKLQYTEKSLNIIPNFNFKQVSAKIAGKEEVHVFNFATQDEIHTKSQQTREYTQRCSTQFDTKKKLTGNTRVINTVVPIYDRVWVPRVCETICGGPLGADSSGSRRPTPINDGCYRDCREGYYRNIIIGYNYINTRLEATHRNYKIVCFIGCWDDWDKRHAEITVSGVYNQTIRPGNVKKYGWVKDISPRSSGTLTVTYRSDLSFLLFGACTTQISW